ncbi:MAG: cysteine hydrolase [Solobacterium sp.]|nr:cysteine hydrolase [Solobacterium sp.]
MKRLLVVVDMQKDFVDGSLGTKEAQAILPAVREKIESYPQDCVYATLDTHQKNYLETNEGKHLPVEHCIEGTEGWRIHPEIADALKKAVFVVKPTFGSVKLMEMLKKENEKEEISVELIGLCTDICVISNALLLKAAMPEITISVDAGCCAGVTPEKHTAALETMRSCQIEVINGDAD